MKKIIIASLAVFLAYTVVGCSSDEDENGKPQEEQRQTEDGPKQAAQGNGGRDSIVVDMLPQTKSVELTAAQRAYVSKLNDFAFSLYGHAAANSQLPASNIMSPLSVASLLGMLNNGAQAQTSEEISRLLGSAPADKPSVNGFFQALMGSAPAVDPSVLLRMGNFVSMNRNFSLSYSDQFRDILGQSYQAEASQLDFLQPSTLDYINGWSARQTDGQIPQILDKLPDNAVLILMNAIAFKATWTEKFDEADTREETFTSTAGHQLLPLMRRKATALYASNDVYSTLCLPYGSGDKWSMMVLLPQKGKTVADVVASLSTGSWQSNVQALSKALADIRIPRFSTTSDVDLIGPLREMGAPSMFDAGAADFSLMTKEAARLYVTTMKQRAAIEVNEAGTKMASVTVASLEVGAAFEELPSVQFHADRPFVYLIQESSSGAVFFIGTFDGR